MRRLCFNLLAGFSFLLCLASITLWIWSEIGDVAILAERITAQKDGSGELTRYQFEWRNGGIDVELHRLRMKDLGPKPLSTRLVTNYAPTRSRTYPVYPAIDTVLGFQYVSTRANFPPRIIASQFALTIPFYALVLLFLILPACWTIRRRRRRRLRAGHCRVCGYDLRVQLALSEQGESNGRASLAHCPECGTPASPALQD